ncbi:MAG: RHS repeat-associated core domain-containing protein, partial [Tepidiformaceae bacterium]
DDNGTPTGGETTFVYDADGARLIRKTPTDTTLYIDSHELTLTGPTLTTKRSYTLGGVTVAVRDSAGSGALTYLLGDQLGSTTTSVNASTGATQTQRFLPYGAPRSVSIAATDRGWIGQTKDNSTGLQYLNASYYDPTIGRFTATDPLADLGRPSTLDAYGYAGGSPVTMSDPSGLLMTVGSGGKGDYTYGAVYTRTGRIVGGNPSGRPPRWVQEAIDQFVGGNPVHYPDDPVMDAAVQAGFAPTGSSDPLGDAMRAGGRFFFDPSQCEDKASWGCSIQTAGLLPWGKLGKLGKLGRFLRFGDNADEFADAAKAVGPTISRQRQLRHVANTEDWIARGKGGYFNSVDDAQSVLDGVHDGSAVLLGRTRNGDLVRHDGVTGFNNNAAAGYVDQPTNVFIVKGTSSPSVVPTSPRAKPAG